MRAELRETYCRSKRQVHEKIKTSLDPCRLIGGLRTWVQSNKASNLQESVVYCSASRAAIVRLVVVANEAMRIASEAFKNAPLSSLLVLTNGTPSTDSLMIMRIQAARGRYVQPMLVSSTL